MPRRRNGGGEREGKEKRKKSGMDATLERRREGGYKRGKRKEWRLGRLTYGGKVGVEGGIVGGCGWCRDKREHSKLKLDCGKVTVDSGTLSSNC